MENGQKKTSEEVMAMVFLTAIIIGGAACIVYALAVVLGIVHSGDRPLLFVGIALIGIGLAYRWTTFIHPKLVDAKIREQVDQAEEEEWQRIAAEALNRQSSPSYIPDDQIRKEASSRWE